MGVVTEKVWAAKDNLSNVELCSRDLLRGIVSKAEGSGKGGELSRTDLWQNRWSGGVATAISGSRADNADPPIRSI